MDRSELDPLAPTTLASPRRRTTAGPLDVPHLAELANWLTGEPHPPKAPKQDTRVDSAHSPAAAPLRSRWLLYSPGSPRENRDRLVTLRDGGGEASYVDAVRNLLSQGRGIAVAGKRQGRVAAGMIADTLLLAGHEPTVLLRNETPRRGRDDGGPLAVVDVSTRLDALAKPPAGPEIAVVLENGQAADSPVLARFFDWVTPQGMIFAASETESTTPRVETLSLERGSTWWGADLREDRGRFRFRAFHRGRFAAEIRLRAPGRGNVLSALAAVAVCLRVDVPAREIKQALEDFAGVSRGFESRGSYRGVTLVDDDAVAPRELAEAIAIARAVHGGRRLWGVFFAEGPPVVETVGALRGVDVLLLLGAARDAESWQDMLRDVGAAARLVADLDEALDNLDRHLEPGDVLLTLGTGDVGTIADAFLRRLPRDRPLR